MSYETALTRIRQAAEEGAASLDLSNLYLDALPPEIGELQSLTTLDLSFNQLTALPPEVGKLQNLTELDLRANQLPALPPEVGELQDLTELDLRDNELTALPPEVGELQNLTELVLWNNQLAALPPEVGKLQNLTTLDLRVNELTALPPEVGKLQNLTELDLRDNELTALPPEVGKLQNLTTLDLSLNQLTALPPEVGKLQNLTELNLGGNQLTALPPEVGKLQNLTKLDLSRNRLTALPPEVGKLQNLTTLILWDNQLTALPPEIGKLQNLTELDLWDNQLTALPPEIGKLQNLTKLDLWNNKLTALPPEMENLTRLERLNLQGNPLTLALPRALLGENFFGPAQALLRFYRAVWQAGAALGEARVLFVGQPSVGKTSLVYRLKDGSYQENRLSTMTVETHKSRLGDLHAHFWDFGGQESMHATHPFFFSARCVYVLVLNVRQTYEQNRVEYWLRTIRAFGGDSPVLVVGNHAEPGQHLLELETNRLRREFPNILAFLQTSAQKNSGIEALRAELEKAVNALPHVRVAFARAHLQVKAALEQQQQAGQNIIPYESYRALCREQDISGEEDQKTLLALLHDLGVILDFRNEAGEPLSPDGVLDPNWVANAVYAIITDQELRGSAAGLLTEAMSDRILRKYETWHRSLILNLLQRFELAYPAEKGLYLPGAMPQDEPAAAADPAWEKALTFEYAYPELPESVITRFIVRAHEWKQPGRVWRWGILLQWNDNSALVRANLSQKKVEIRINGGEHTRRDFLALIRGHFEVIHKSFRESAGAEAFPVQAFLCPPQYPGIRLDYQDLLIRERNNRDLLSLTWKNNMLDLSVTEMLNGFTSPEARDKERKQLFPEEEHMPKEIHYHEHKHFESRDVSNAVVNLGDGNQIQQSITAASPELQQTLQQLTAAVNDLLPHLSAGQAAEARDDLEGLQEELAKPQPRKKWYNVSIEGLIQAAKNVGEVGAPVIALAGRLLELLQKQA